MGLKRHTLLPLSKHTIFFGNGSYYQKCHYQLQKSTMRFEHGLFSTCTHYSCNVWNVYNFRLKTVLPLLNEWPFYITDLTHNIITSFQYHKYWGFVCVVLNKRRVNCTFISCKFVKGFLEITFLSLVISSWNFHNVCQLFFIQLETKFQLDGTKN